MFAIADVRKGSRHLPWQAPTTILLSLLAGVLLAIGHHVFYSSLDGRQARTDGYKILGSDVSPQQLNVAIGTAFAFLVRAALVTAISTAYLQLVWRALLRAAQGSTLGDLDTAFSALSNIISLSKVWVWWRLPLLFALAMVAWLLPLAAIITPATLSIEAALVIPAPSTLQTVPTLAFESLNFVDDMPSVPNGDDASSVRFAYTLPSRETIEVVKAVAATGSIFPIKPPSSNASWTLDFLGPALKCTNISKPFSSAILSNIASAVSASSECFAYGYLAWLEGLPFVNASTDGQYQFNSRVFQGSSMPAVLYLVGFPEAMKLEEYGSPPAACLQPTATFFESQVGAVMLQCELSNSDYHTAFKYTNGLPDISVSTELHDEPPLQTVSSVNCSIASDTDSTCDLTPATMRMLSYQAIMDAFTYLITGYAVVRPNDTSAYIQTQVISTPLAGTQELEFISRPLLEQGKAALAKPLQQSLLDWAATKDQGLVSITSSAHAISLAETIERLFQNVTVSMMSQAHLRPNMSSVFAPPPVNVTQETYHNIYTYSTAKLWIAYGIAIIFTASAALLGLVAVAASGASYSSSSNFSSVFRLARGTFLSAGVQDDDLDGRDPLPEHLAKARMWPLNSRVMRASRVDSMLVNQDRRNDDIALSDRPNAKSTGSHLGYSSLPGGQPEIEPPAKPWSAL